MRAAFLASAVLLATVAHAQSPRGTAVETGKTQQAACEAAGVRAASMAQGNDIALKRSNGRRPDVQFTSCQCQEKVTTSSRSWTCSRSWALQTGNPH